MSEEDIFHIARSIGTVDERSRFLDNACGDDSGLRQRVTGLLESYSQAGDFLEVVPPGIDQRQTKADGTTDFSSDDIPASGSLAATLPTDVNIPAAPLGQLGPYLLMEEVGAGGMGRVARAVDSRLNREVAIKVLAPALVASPQSLKRFLREAQSAALVKHENVVTIYNIEDVDGVPFLVMEFVHGRSLEQHLVGGRRFTPEEIVRIGLEAGRGLEAAHRRGLIHRDIKPANVLLEEPNERVKITDFGLARLADDISVTSDGSIAGTPQYMSPEQAQAQPLDARSDLFSLGAVLYALCTGKAAFAADSTYGVLRCVCSEQPVPIRDLAPETPAALAGIIDRLLEKKPDDRFQSSSDLVQALSALAPGSALQVVPPAKAPRKRWPCILPLSIATAVLVVAILAGIILTIRSGQGTIVLEIDQPEGVTVSVDGDDIVITDTRKEIPIASGPHRILARFNGKTLKNEEIEVLRNKQRVVRITRTEDKPEPVKTTKTPSKLESKAPTTSQGPPVPATAEAAKTLQTATAEALKLPVSFTNSLGMTFRLIPPGEFVMGATPEEIEAVVTQIQRDYPLDKYWPERLRSQGPKHRVVITRPFYLATCETTQGHYQAVIGSNPAAYAPGGMAADRVKDLPAAELPVDMVSWKNAVEFCRMLSKKDKLPQSYQPWDEPLPPKDAGGYRLPTEAEWEYACRGGTQGQAWSGDTQTAVGEGDWLMFNSLMRPNPVGRRKANPFGLFDLYGNVQEWCQDVWEPQYQAGVVDGVASDPTGPAGMPPENGGRVIRGGTWGYELLRTRSTLREIAHPDQVTMNLGFRVVLPVEAVRDLLNRKTASAAPARPASSGKFSIAPQKLDTTQTVAVALGDLDGDGDLDAVSAGFFSVSRVWLNDGRGELTAGQELGTVAGFAVVIGDLDQDRDLDVILVSTNNDNSAHASQVWFNDGHAKLTPAERPLAVLKTNDAVLADMDKDGDLDLVASAWGSELFLWTNDGHGNFDGPKGLSEVADHTGVAAGDLDGDGDLDVIGTHWGHPGVDLFRRSESGAFERGEVPAIPECTSVAVADLDGDGDLDAFVTTAKGDRILVNDGKGRFTESGEPLGSRGSEAVALGDLDGDSDIDAVTVPTLHETNRVRIVWRNDGHGRFTVAQELPAAESVGLALGDLNGDGSLDLWLASQDQQPSEIWFNQSIKP